MAALAQTRMLSGSRTSSRSTSLRGPCHDEAPATSVSGRSVLQSSVALQASTPPAVQWSAAMVDHSPGNRRTPQHRVPRHPLPGHRHQIPLAVSPWRVFAKPAGPPADRSGGTSRRTPTAKRAEEGVPRPGEGEEAQVAADADARIGEGLTRTVAHGCRAARHPEPGSRTRWSSRSARSPPGPRTERTRPSAPARSADPARGRRRGTRRGHRVTTATPGAVGRPDPVHHPLSISAGTPTSTWRRRRLPPRSTTIPATEPRDPASSAAARLSPAVRQQPAASSVRSRGRAPDPA